MTAPVDAATDTASAGELRDRMVDTLLDNHAIRTPEVEAVMRAVPRELFLPGVALTDVYNSHDVVRLRWDENGRCISSASAPWLVARMLEQARLRPGHRVLEIGTATGVNSAYCSALVGQDDPAGAAGRVDSVEILPDMAQAVREALDNAGVRNVNVILGDGEHGAPQGAPFDAIIVTVQAPDLATAWLDQLKPGGRLVVPLTVRGLSRSFTFEPQGDHWITTERLQCGFVNMQGEGANPPRRIELGQDAQLVIDDGQPADAHTLTAALSTEAHQLPTAVLLGAGEDALPHMDMWLAVALDTFGHFVHVGDYAKPSTMGWTVGLGDAATWDQDSIAYVALHPRPDLERTYELVAWGHGPNGRTLAEALADEVRLWDRDLRTGPEPVIRAYRAGTPDGNLAAGRVVNRRNTRMVLSRQ
ncbi:methyltransferase, FxLD system [Streptacidiphilus albus]|uniref:methyltransferase, FxLD system n=1 Tax=Streptacidiphilus albus TaxID=105425 RepID=UPI00054B4F37|nr:methyltransferase, FxLD system [Streptacidiphilus albus]